jgi:hypothetical protein
MADKDRPHHGTDGTETGFAQSPQKILLCVSGMLLKLLSAAGGWGAVPPECCRVASWIPRANNEGAVSEGLFRTIGVCGRL